MRQKPPDRTVSPLRHHEKAHLTPRNHSADTAKRYLSHRDTIPIAPRYHSYRSAPRPSTPVKKLQAFDRQLIAKHPLKSRICSQPTLPFQRRPSRAPQNMKILYNRTTIPATPAYPSPTSIRIATLTRHPTPSTTAQSPSFHPTNITDLRTEY